MTKVLKIDTSKNIKQSNRLVVARYRLTKYEQRMMIAICSQIQKNADEFETIRLNVKDLADFCNFKGEDAYRKVHTTMVKLMSRTLQIQMDNGKWYLTHWLQTAKYLDGGLIEYRIDQDLKPELLQLKSAYLSTAVAPLMNFKRDYSARLYFILKKLVRLRTYIYDLDFFRDRFQLGNTYKQISNLKNRVLEPALKEINEKSDILVRHEYIKEGRTYTKISFMIALKDEEEIKTDKKEIATPATTEQTEPPQLTSSAVDTAETAEPINNSAGVALLKSLDINPPSASTTDKKEEPAPTPAVDVEKNEATDLADGGEGTNWTEEQQADYDQLIKYDIWQPVAKNIVDTLTHAQIIRNVNGVLKANTKGNIRDLSAVLYYAIKNDTYKGVEEEKQKLKEREQERRKAEYEAQMRAEKEREEQRARERAEQEEMAKIREKYTPEELNQVMAEVKIDYDNNGEFTAEMAEKLSKYGINNRQFYFYRTGKKKFKDELRTNQIEKVINENKMQLDFKIDLNDEKSILKIIKAYYENGKICPTEISQELKKQGLTWGIFQSKFYEKFILIGRHEG